VDVIDVTEGQLAVDVLAVLEPTTPELVRLSIQMRSGVEDVEQVIFELLLLNRLRVVIGSRGLADLREQFLVLLVRVIHNGVHGL